MAADFSSIYAEPETICEHLPQLCAWLESEPCVFSEMIYSHYLNLTNQKKNRKEVRHGVLCCFTSFAGYYT